MKYDSGKKDLMTQKLDPFYNKEVYYKKKNFYLTFRVETYKIRIQRTFARKT